LAAKVVAVTSRAQGEVQHLESVWRDRGNFIIAADILSQTAVA
jgi:hypothetical protein